MGQVEGGSISTRRLRWVPSCSPKSTLKPGIATYEGTFEITTKKGTIEFELFDGVLDLATNSGTNDSVVTGGAGRFEGASGGLFFEDSVGPNGESVDHVTGVICRA